MNIKIKLNKQKERPPNLQEPIPAGMLDLLAEGAEQSHFAAATFTVLLQELTINGFTVGLHNFSSVDNIDIPFYYRSPCAVLQFMMEGPGSAVSFQGGQEVAITNRCLLCHVTNRDPFLFRFKAGDHRVFQIQFPFSLLEKLRLKDKGEGHVLNVDGSYLEGPVIIQKKIYFTIKQIIKQSKKSGLDFFYLNRRCLELLHGFIKDLDANRQLERWINQKQPELEKFRNEVDLNLSDPKMLRSMLPFLIRKMNVSQYQFDKISKELFGMTIPAFIKARRMEKAMEILTQTKTPAGEVGVMVGYEEFSTFSRAFTKHFGKPPSFYRS